MKTSIPLILLLFAFSNSAFSQGEIIDDFSRKALPDWIFGGVQMKYSHEEDNKENGFAEILTDKEINPREFIGKIFLKRPHMFKPGNFVNIMMDGAKNDAYVTIQIVYDSDNNKRYDREIDAMLVSSPVSMNFSGWKEIKIKLDQDNFKLESKAQTGFEVTEDDALGIQLEFSSGADYVTSVFKSGIALVSEIQNKEALEGFDNTDNSESFFNASNTPNPFNPVTTISYTLPNSTNVSITVYDGLGREVEQLVNQMHEAGTHTIEFNAGDLPGGIYFYRIKTPERTEVRKMVLSK